MEKHLKRKCCQSLGRWKVSIGRTEWTKLATRSLILYKICTTNTLCTLNFYYYKYALYKICTTNTLSTKICTSDTVWQSNKYKDMLQILKYTNCVAVHIMNIPKRYKSKNKKETSSLKIQKNTLEEKVLFDTILQYWSPIPISKYLKFLEKSS